MTNTTPLPLPGEQGQHYELIKQAIPSWMVNSSPERRQALKQTPVQIPAWYDAASQVQKDQLKTLFDARGQSQIELEKSFGIIQALDAFSQPLLVAALKAAGHELDVNQTYLRLYIPAEDAFGVRTGGFKVKTLSLLQAALGNFGAREAAVDFFNSTSGFITAPDERGHFERHTTALKIHEFATLCRDLDLGAKYQVHLKAVVKAEHVTDRTVVRKRYTNHQKDAFKAAAYMALLKRDIGDSDYALLMRVLAGEKRIMVGSKQVWYRSLSVMGLHAHDCLIIDPCIRGRYSSWIIVYIPEHPDHPIKRYETFNDFRNDLTDYLTASASRKADRSNQWQATPNQHFFGRFVAVKDRSYYYKRLTELVLDAPPQPLGAQWLRSEWGRILTNLVAPPYSSITSTLGEPQPSVRVAITEPEFNIVPVAIDGLWKVVDLWTYRYASLRQRLLNDARSQAVSTADVDEASRSLRAAHYLNIGMFVLNLAAMAIPPLGEMMAVAMAGQLLYEVVEGAIELNQGDREAGWAHITDVVENLAMLAAGATLHFTVSPFIEELKAVTLPSGKTRLWKPDLAPYKAAIELPAEATPDALGLYQHNGQTVLPHEGDHYQVRQEPDTGQYRIQHPRRPGAYEPLLEHNNAGVWSHEVEEPLTWDKPTLMRRLGLEQRGLDAQTLEQARIASGVEEDVLRQTFVEHDPLPLLLEDSIQHFKVHQELTTFVEQMRSSDPAVYAQADPVLQLQMMRRRGMLPVETPLRVMSNGKIVWEDDAPVTSTRRVADVTPSQLARGELLSEVLNTLQGIDPTLKEIPGTTTDTLEVRAGKLRQYLGDTVDTYKGPLVEERYKGLTASQDLDLRWIVASYPQLPTSMATQLLKSLSAEQLQALRSSGLLPEAQAEQAKWCEQETRVSRAYEGLHLDTLAGLDSQRLALRTLETLPGWPRGTRVELRQYSVEGPLLDAIGSPDWPQTKVLVQMDSGLFQAPSPSDFYTATWEALSMPERQGLGFTDAQQLKAAIQQSPLPREPLRTVLLEQPVRKPPYDPAMRLLGGAGGIRQWLTRETRTPESRAKKLYPTLEDHEIATILQGLGDDVSGGLKRLKKEYKDLEKMFKVWTRANATLSDDAVLRCENISKSLLRCWKRERAAMSVFLGAPKELEMALPALNADFSHVRSIDLTGFKWSDSTTTFLQNFTQLKTLNVSGFSGLTALPDVIGDMKSLTSLSMDYNGLRLTPQSAAKLSSLSNLEYLSLAGNPLGTVPDFSGMSRLEHVVLRDTGIDRWPTGLRAETGLRSVDLGDNQLSEVPEVNLNPPTDQFESIARLNSVTLLDGNPFPDDYWRKFDSFWRRLGQERPDLVVQGYGVVDKIGAFDSGNPGVKRYRRMYPRKSHQQAREFIWNLGAGVDAELSRLEQEYAILTNRLDAWVWSGGEVQGARRTAERHILNCWRREMVEVFNEDDTMRLAYELNLNTFSVQTLPDLGVDFSHVEILTLDHMNLSTPPEGFLSRFKQVQTLTLTGNALRSLPHALGEMQGLKELRVVGNRVVLTPQTSEILASRTALQQLWLNDNPLGITPDFSRMTDLRVLNLRNTGIDTWPRGLFDQPELRWVDLMNNQITTIPDAVIAPTEARLAQTKRINDVTHLRNNPLSALTQQRVLDYGERLRLAGLEATNRSNAFVEEALGGLVWRPLARAPRLTEFQRWTTGMSTDQVASKRALWDALRVEPKSDGFFNQLVELTAMGTIHADQQRRVWELIDAISQNTPESDRLRVRVLELGGEGACCDRAEFIFSNMELTVLSANARAAAGDQAPGLQLRKLARGLFRLDEVDRIAAADIARSQAIVNDPSVRQADKMPHAQRLGEEIEIRLHYRFFLKDRLQLPGQPAHMQFIEHAKVTQAMLDAAYQEVVALDYASKELESLLSREFWPAYLEEHYQKEFYDQSKPHLEQLAELAARYEAGKVSEAFYHEEAEKMQAVFTADKQTLTERLTRREMAEHALDG